MQVVHVSPPPWQVALYGVSPVYPIKTRGFVSIEIDTISGVLFFVLQRRTFKILNFWKFESVKVCVQKNVKIWKRVWNFRKLQDLNFEHSKILNFKFDFKTRMIECNDFIVVTGKSRSKCRRLWSIEGFYISMISLSMLTRVILKDCNTHGLIEAFIFELIDCKVFDRSYMMEDIVTIRVFLIYTTISQWDSIE